MWIGCTEYFEQNLYWCLYDICGGLTMYIYMDGHPTWRMGYLLHWLRLAGEPYTFITAWTFRIGVENVVRICLFENLIAFQSIKKVSMEWSALIRVLSSSQSGLYNSPWARGGHRYHQRGPHFNGTMLFRNMNCNYFCLLDIPNW